jgi:flagellar hook protein FlgE
MSFQTGLSGLNASSRSLDVIGNNIANANTTGMKSSRAEFSDLVASSLGAGGGSNGPGIGVAVQTISQQFSQGNITTSGNSLDVAINGGGFFQLTQTDGSTAYTRDGAFKLNKDGYLVTNTGANVMGYPTDKLGNPTSASIVPLQLPTNAPIAASATTTITAEFNLDARAKVAATLPVTPRSTYGTSLTLYDSQGTTVPVSLYFEKLNDVAGPPALNRWAVYDSLTAAVAVTNMDFDSTGTLVSSPTTPLTVITPSSVTPSITATLDISKVTQFGAAFAMTSLTQDGYAPGELASLSIGENGVITARYSNGQTQYNGKITLADFRNVQGLTPLGGNAWASTIDSGLAMQGSPSEGKYGSLRAGALEESNVDLTSELVNMMTAQRAYQANAQTIKTQDQIMSTLVNLR